MNPNRWNPFIVLMSEAGDGGDGGGNGGNTGDGDNSTPPANVGNQTLLNQQAEKSWWESLPKELHNPYVTQTKDLGSFVKSAIDTKSMVGANTIKLPGKDASPEERAEFYNKLGRPAEPTAYKTSLELGEGVIDTKVLESMTGKFHELGLSEAQGNGILDAYLGIVSEGVKQHTQSQEQVIQAGIAELQREWGDGYDNKLKTAQLAVRELGDETLIAMFDSTGLSNNPSFIKFLANVGNQLLDDDATGGDAGRFTGTAPAAAAELARLKQDSEFMKILDTRHDPGHKAAVDKWMNLHKQAFPENQQKD